MKKLKIVHVTQALGGVEVSLRNIVENVDAQLIESIIISSSKTMACLSKTLNTVITLHIPFVREINPIKDGFALLLLIRCLYNIKPDVLHCHSSKAGFLGRIAGAILGVPTIYSPHGLSILCTDKKFIWKIYCYLEKMMIPITACYLACSESELELGRNVLGFNPKKSMLWKNCLSEARFSNVFQKKQSTSYICCVARPSYQKNIEMLVNTIKFLNDSDRTVLVKLVGIGHYAPQSDYLDDLIKTANIGNLIERIPWVEPKQSLEIIASSLAVVLTSRYEGLPLTVIEAMALGKVVVATDVLGTKDIVLHNKTGILVPLDDFVAMAHALIKIEEDVVFKETLEKNAIEEFRKSYNTLTQIKYLEEIYSKVSLTIKPNS